MPSRFVLVLLLSLVGEVLSAPSTEGKLIKMPPPQTFTGTKRVPDAGHPFRAPKKGDQRGPCPGLNTLANHGYIPRNGIASFEEVVSGAVEGFNMGPDIASGLTAFTMLARGNSYINLLSIGGPSPLIPPLPGKIDGPIVKGMATHGRFEGDVSMTRYDYNIGDNVAFHDELFDQLLISTGQFGEDDPVTGNRSVLTPEALSNFKLKRFLDSQVNNPGLQYHIGRYQISYFETGLTLELFANGTTGKTAFSTAAFFFRNQTFPPNFYRRNAPGTVAVVGAAVGKVVAFNPPFLVPGANINGKYVPDANNTEDCIFPRDLIINNVPAVYDNTTGLFKQNVDFLVQVMNDVFGGPTCPPVRPGGPSEA